MQNDQLKRSLQDLRLRLDALRRQLQTADEAARGQLVEQARRLGMDTVHLYRVNASGLGVRR